MIQEEVASQGALNPVRARDFSRRITVDSTLIPSIRHILQREKKVCKVTASGESMSPLIKEGNVLSISWVAPEKLGVGEIAVFDAGGALCVHRIIKKSYRAGRYMFLSKSDRSLIPDSPFGQEELVGKVSLIQKKTVTLDLESLPWGFLNRALGVWHRMLLVCASSFRAIKSGYKKRG